MALVFDIAAPIFGDAQRVALVQAIFGATADDEKSWLEWKGPLDLGSRNDQATLAKAIAGLANRAPEAAKRACAGHGYVVVGAEPGSIGGQERCDPAVLADRLQPFLGRHLRWEPHWVLVESLDVLVVEVDSPREGDPVYPMRRGASKFHDGAIFVRGPGKTEFASSQEVDGFFSRSRRQPHLHGLSVDIESGRAVLIEFHQGERESWLADREMHLMAGMNDYLRRRDMRSRLQMVLLSQGQHDETRTPEEFEAEVKAYIADCREVLLDVGIAGTVARTQPLLIRLSNLTEDNVPAIEVEVRFSGSVHALDDDAVHDLAELPEPPREYGPYPMFNVNPLFVPTLTSPTAPAAGPYVVTANDGRGTTVTFANIDLRPTRSIVLPRIWVLTSTRGTLPTQWSATSSGFPGTIEDEVQLPVRTEAVTLREMLPSPTD